MKDFGESREVIIMVAVTSKEPEEIQKPHLAVLLTEVPVKLDHLQSHLPAGFGLVTAQRN